MKLEQQQQAQHLYFQTDLSKTEIANLLGVSRRSLHYWVQANNWERLKKSAQHMPSLIAEDCYIIMSKFTETILSETRIMRAITKEESDILRSLSLTIRNLKNRSTVNESLEMMSFFIEHVNRKDPEMASKIKPFISDYIATRGAAQPWQFMHEKFNDMGHIPVPDAPSVNGDQKTEEQLDLEDIIAWTESETPSLSSRMPEGHERSSAEGGRVNDEENNLAQSNIHTADGTAAATPSPLERAGVRPNRAQRRAMARAAKAA